MRIPSAFRLTIVLAAALAAVHLAPARAEVWSGTLLDRPIGIEVPAPFGPEPAFSDMADASAITEFLPPGESIDGWTQMLTLTALGGMTQKMTAEEGVEAMAANLANGYAAACPDGFNAQDLGAPAVPGAEAVLAGWLACDQVNGNGQSEAMVVLILVAGGTIYTVQWAEHGPATDGPPVFDQGRWLPRLDSLMTLAL